MQERKLANDVAVNEAARGHVTAHEPLQEILLLSPKPLAHKVRSGLGQPLAHKVREVLREGLGRATAGVDHPQQFDHEVPQLHEISQLP